MSDCALLDLPSKSPGKAQASTGTLQRRRQRSRMACAFRDPPVLGARIPHRPKSECGLSQLPRPPSGVGPNRRVRPCASHLSRLRRPHRSSGLTMPFTFGNCSAMLCGSPRDWRLGFIEQRVDATLVLRFYQDGRLRPLDRAPGQFFSPPIGDMRRLLCDS